MDEREAAKVAQRIWRSAPEATSFEARIIEEPELRDRDDRVVSLRRRVLAITIEVPVSGGED